MTDYRCHEITVLSKLPKADEAKRLLEKVCWQVQPIMRKRSWQVSVVAEFMPKSPGLLGLNTNAGNKIQIRMRQTKDSDFFPFQDLLGTMLHELVHNEIGPHNAKFYAMLDELNKECDALEDKGLGGSGTGFDLAGAKLSNEAHNPTSRDGRLKGLRAAEERSRKQQLMGGGGVRLGGNAPPANRTPSQMAAEAALRRLRDDQWCHSDRGSQQPENAEKSASSEALTSVTEATRFDSKGPVSELSDRPISSKRSIPDSPHSDKQPTPARSALKDIKAFGVDAGVAVEQNVPAKRPRPRSFCTGWQCSGCTLLNDASRLDCAACGAPKSQGLAGRWCRCSQCIDGTAPGRSALRRRCPACTYLNVASPTSSCAMCGAELPPAIGTLSVAPDKGEVVVLD